MRVPEWIEHRFSAGVQYIESLHYLLGGLAVHTVCEEARCPNIGECFRKGTVTFIILGDVCTRSCGFCGVKKGIPIPVDDEEPHRVAAAVYRLSPSYAVITSVTRDDLLDGGADQFVATIREIHKLNPAPTVELLLPMLDLNPLKRVVAIHPGVIGHNVETVPRLYPKVRYKFSYSDSIKFLGKVKELDSSIITKSGLMVGLGETMAEVMEVMKDLRGQQVDILTIGQYLRPSGRQVPVVEYVSLSQFAEYERIGYALGFRYVASGPYVRSSYRAQQVWEAINL